ncbi:MAG: glycoside hydrolase family 16 protein, partial [Mariniphaga sp.]|nr:glycoside hydrolase family 16 protein [Mariniphaga sp.]
SPKKFATAQNGEEHVDEVFFEGFDQIDSKIWRVVGWTEHGGKTSPDRCYAKDGILNMIFINDPDQGNLGSAIQTEVEFLYGRWEARLKPSDVPGILNSFYTIDWDNTAISASDNDGTKQEIDIEFLTKSFTGNTGEVHIALHERGKKSYQSNPDFMLDFDPSSEFHIWGFDVTPEYLEWFVDDHIIYRYEYEGNPIRVDSPYYLKLNSWTSENWVGGPPEEGVECVYQIDWIKFTPMRLLKKKDFNKTPLFK